MLPTVHRQLEGIRQGLEDGSLSHPRAIALLDEVASYLAQRSQDLADQVPVAHSAIISSREDRAQAFERYGDSMMALKEYLASGDAVQLEVARYTAEQGTASLAAARLSLMEAEPPPPSEEETQAT